jgi:hypothetical protein
VNERTEDAPIAGTEPDPWKDGPRWSDSPADPWADAPAWSDGSPSPDPVAESTGEPEAAMRPADSSPEPPSCPWCATPAAPDATRCSSCGAALAQRESIGDLVIPGLTAVDPALQDLKDRPLHLTGPSPSHGVASSVIAAAALGGPVGLAIIGGVGAVAAAEYMGANRTGPDGVPVDQVGQASGAVLQAIEKLDRGETLAPASSSGAIPRNDQEEEPHGG